jgi:hypothetical protein
MHAELESKLADELTATIRDGSLVAGVAAR